MRHNKITINRYSSNSSRWFGSFSGSFRCWHQNGLLFSISANAMQLFDGSLCFRCFNNNRGALYRSHRTKMMWTTMVATHTAIYRRMGVSSRRAALLKIWDKKKSKLKSCKVTIPTCSKHTVNSNRGSEWNFMVYYLLGSYSYTSPEGTPITVTYIADENGS